MYYFSCDCIRRTLNEIVGWGTPNTFDALSWVIFPSSTAFTAISMSMGLYSFLLHDLRWRGTSGKSTTENKMVLITPKLEKVVLNKLLSNRIFKLNRCVEFQSKRNIFLVTNDTPLSLFANPRVALFLSLNASDNCVFFWGGGAYHIY